MKFITRVLPLIHRYLWDDLAEARFLGEAGVALPRQVGLMDIDFQKKIPGEGYSIPRNTGWHLQGQPVILLYLNWQQLMVKNQSEGVA